MKSILQRWALLIVSTWAFSVGIVAASSALASTPTSASSKSAAAPKSAAVKTSAKMKNRPESRLGAKLGTDFQFDEMSVRGRYQSAYEGVARVEDEKLLEDLLDYRRDYKDRLLKSVTQK